MKKILIVLSLMVSMFVLAACQDEPESNIVTNEILNQIEVGYESGDDAESVTKDLDLLTSLEGLLDVELVWSSSNPEYIEINGSKGLVHQQATDVDVTLTVKVTRALDTKYKYFNLVVLRVENTVVEDTVAPVITGTKDFELELGATIPNWLEAISATDDVDGHIVVVVDDSAVDLEVPGTYDLIYSATDSSNNKTSITVKVTVLPEQVEVDKIAPVITGTKDIDYIMGENLPNYLEGVSATDDVDGHIVVVVDDSEVNLDVPGTYDLIYTATDSSNNTDIVIVTVTVIDNSVDDEAETYVETFGNLSLSGSSYVDGTFIGVNSIVWTYKGSRGDQDLNGNALTFGGKIDDNSSLKATIDNGIQSISLKYSKPFGNSQNYGVYINNQLIGEFIAQDSISTFEKVLDTPITGTFELEIKPVNAGSGRAQITIDDLTWTNAPINKKPIEQQNAESDRDSLSIQTSFIQNATVNFMMQGAKGSSITWKFVDMTNPANSYVNFTTGEISIPETGSFNVLVSASISNGTYTYNKVFNLTIGEGEPILIESVRSLSNNDYAKTVGTITSIYSNATLSFIFIQDESGAILIHAPKAFATNLVVGDKIEVKASKDVDQNFIILNKVRGIKKVGTGSIAGLVVTADKLALNPAKLVTVSGLISKNYSNNETNFEFITLNGIFNVYIPGDLDASTKLAIQNKLSNLDAGLEVIITAPVVRLGNSYYLYVTNANEVVVADFVYFNDVADIIKANHTAPSFGTTLTEDITLTKDSDLLFGATINWVSSNTEVLSNTGVISKSSDPVSVTLTYTILFDGEVVDSKTFNLTIASLSNYTGYYASLSNKSGQALEEALRNLIRNTGIATNSTGATSNVQYVDKFEGKNYNIYTGFGAYGNREHVWPNSQLGNRKYDLHNLRAAVESVNSKRGNDPFTNAVTGLEWQSTGGTFYPGSEHIGDVARIVLYISIFENISLNRVGRFSNLQDNINMFLEWHEADPVSDFELSRNGKIFEIQSNRNPFIDHPELVYVLFS